MAAERYPRVPTAPPEESTTRIQLPWSESAADAIYEGPSSPGETYGAGQGSRLAPACGSDMVPIDGDADGTPEPIDDDPISGVRALPLPLPMTVTPTRDETSDGVVTPEPEPVYRTRTRALAVLSIGERLALMKAVEIAARRSGIDVGVSAMPSYAPTAVHLQAANWRDFCAWLKGQARGDCDFRDVALELSLPVGKREAARYTLRCLAGAAPEMLRLRVGDVLYLPFRD